MRFGLIFNLLAKQGAPHTIKYFGVVCSKQEKRINAARVMRPYHCAVVGSAPNPRDLRQQSRECLGSHDSVAPPPFGDHLGVPIRFKRHAPRKFAFNCTRSCVFYALNFQKQ